MDWVIEVVEGTLCRSFALIFVDLLRFRKQFLLHIRCETFVGIVHTFSSHTYVPLPFYSSFFFLKKYSNTNIMTNTNLKTQRTKQLTWSCHKCQVDNVVHEHPAQCVACKHFWCDTCENVID
jgi:hypothetical protein